MQVAKTLAALALFGCVDLSDDTQKDGDTSGSEDTDTDSGTGTDCSVHLTDVNPADGAVGVYYRDPLVLSFDGDGTAADIRVTDSAGADVATSEAWQDGNVQVWVYAELEGAQSYDLAVTIEGCSYATGFTTSDIGTPLTIAPGDLEGRTYTFALNEANITTPSIIEGFDDDYFTQPLLFMVTQADTATVTLLGAPGEGESGSYSQVADEPTWDFPAADFTELPYFVTYSDYIELSYQGTPIPIYGFTFEGVFSSDGSSIEAGAVGGLVDTREMYAFLGLPENPEAICDYASSFGVYCEACPDGNDYCLTVVGEDITAPYQSGLTLTEVE